MSAVPDITGPRTGKAPYIRIITAEDLQQSLRDGWTDLLSMRGDIIFAALFYPIVAILAGVLAAGGGLIPLVFPLLAGMALLGPVFAIGFYELARRREVGKASNWGHFFDAFTRPSADSIRAVIFLLVLIFFAWLTAAALIHTALWDGWRPESFVGFIDRLFATREGWALIVVGNVAGAFFALLVLAISVVSLPMLVERDVDARTAIGISVAAFRANARVLIGWGTIVATLLAIGAVLAFVGLALVLPLLGYATWHLYTRLIDRSALPVSID